jgi:hypothetical protein
VAKRRSEERLRGGEWNGRQLWREGGDDFGKRQTACVCEHTPQDFKKTTQLVASTEIQLKNRGRFEGVLGDLNPVFFCFLVLFWFLSFLNREIDMWQQERWLSRCEMTAAFVCLAFDESSIPWNSVLEFSLIKTSKKSSSEFRLASSELPNGIGTVFGSASSQFQGVQLL